MKKEMKLNEGQIQEIRETLYDICCHSVSEEDIIAEAYAFRSYLYDTYAGVLGLDDAFEDACADFCIEL